MGRCLKSVQGLADEIIVVDGKSLDETVSIAKQYKAKVFPTTHKLMFHLNKQMAIDKATGDWILLLDADEEVPAALAGEIKQTIHYRLENSDSGSDVCGYWIPRKNIIFGKWIEHTGWWPDYQLRLFIKGTIKFPCLSVHEHPQITGETAKLIEPLIHHHYADVNQYLERLIRYTDNDVKVMVRNKTEVRAIDALIWPADEFIKRYLTWHGYQDGLHGLVLSLLQSFYRLVVFTKVWEAKHFETGKNPLPVNYVEGILKKKLKEFVWWRYANQIEKSTHRAKRLLLKARRRLGL